MALSDRVDTRVMYEDLSFAVPRQPLTKKLRGHDATWST
jgi:hypothetical protein